MQRCHNIAMKRDHATDFELPDDFVIDPRHDDDADVRMGAGSTLPQDLFALGQPGDTAVGKSNLVDFADTRPSLSMGDAPDTHPALSHQDLPAGFKVMPAAPAVQTSDLQPIIAPMQPAGCLASDGSQPKRVLVVDDDATARLYMRSRLMLRGHAQLLEAASGAEALALVKTQRFDAVLLDVDMGVQNGYDVCRAVRSHVRSVGGKQPRIYMITSRSSMFDKMRAKMAGADAFLSKPPHPGELSELLAQL